MAHGPVPRCLGFPVNHKLKLLALKTLLSAKLYEDKLIFIDSESLEFPKTQLLEAIVSPYGQDKLCFLTPQATNANFSFAAQNLQNISVKQPQNFNLRELLQADYVFITKKGLQEFESIIESREGNYYRNRKVSRPEHIEAMRLKKQNRFERDIILPIVFSETLEGHND